MRRWLLSALAGFVFAVVGAGMALGRHDEIIPIVYATSYCPHVSGGDAGRWCSQVSGEVASMTTRPILFLVCVFGFVFLAAVVIPHSIRVRHACSKHGGVLVESGWSYACVPHLGEIAVDEE